MSLFWITKECKMFGVKFGTVSKVEDDIIFYYPDRVKKPSKTNDECDEVVRKLATTCSLVKATKH